MKRLPSNVVGENSTIVFEGVLEKNNKICTPIEYSRTRNSGKRSRRSDGKIFAKFISWNIHSNFYILIFKVNIVLKKSLLFILRISKMSLVKYF